MTPTAALSTCATQRLSGRAHISWKSMDRSSARYATATDLGIAPKIVATKFQVHGGIMTAAFVKFAADQTNQFATKKVAAKFVEASGEKTVPTTVPTTAAHFATKTVPTTVVKGSAPTLPFQRRAWA